eukprot:scaffold214470_cov48-Attheya_sp.AAC.5
MGSSILGLSKVPCSLGRPTPEWRDRQGRGYCRYHPWLPGLPFVALPPPVVRASVRHQRATRAAIPLHPIPLPEKKTSQSTHGVLPSASADLLILANDEDPTKVILNDFFLFKKAQIP